MGWEESHHRLPLAPKEFPWARAARRRKQRDFPSRIGQPSRGEGGRVVRDRQGAGSVSGPEPEEEVGGILLALFQLGQRQQVRVRHLPGDGEELVDLRLWALEGGWWVPGDGFSLPASQLPNLRRALLDASWVLAGHSEHGEALAEATWDEIRLAARRVARARERLEALRPEDYRRTQDYHRACTLRLRDLRREEKHLREKQTRLLQEGSL
jgi:hypothetical protein